MSDKGDEPPFPHQELSPDGPDPQISFQSCAIRASVRVIGIMMALLISWDVADVFYVFYQT